MSFKMIVDKVMLMTMLVGLTVSNPALKNDPENTVSIVETSEQTMSHYRLPNNTIPRLYKINIEPNMTETVLKWKGESSIDFQVSNATKNLTMHAHKTIVIDENFTELVDTNDNKYKPIKHIRNEALEFLTIEFANDILIGNYTLNLKYEGVDGGEYDGFYKASRRGEPIVAATAFEPTKARRAFPCWDEPALKAQFRLSVKHDRAYTAISNMPMNETVETLDGKNLTKFETTPLMSTYLLTFVIANYKNVSNEHGNVTIWASENLLENVQHVLDTSQKIIDVMKSYTGLSFGLPIVGSVVLPIYSNSGMENWGLVSYREDAIKYDRKNDKAKRLDEINSLIAHELAHSWFGNRVTPRWWNDLWLGEAFAIYFEFYIADKINENSRNMELFIVNHNQDSSYVGEDLQGDVCVRSLAITNDEIAFALGRYGSSSFAKGASIIHMFRNVLTDDVFQAGIRKFLTSYSFKAADADDLMKSFQEAYDESGTDKAPLNVHQAMMPWLIQTGYPMINVTRDYTTGSMRVTQKNIGARENSPKTWWIPLNYATKRKLNFSSTAPSSWMRSNETEVTIDATNNDDWVIFNVQSSGFYRVNYDEENWNKIVEYLNTDNYKDIHVLNRAQLITDVDFLVNREPSRYYQIYWKLINYLSREVDYIPWKAALRRLKSIEVLLRGTEIYDEFTAYVSGLMDKLIEKVGYGEILNEDDQMTKLSKEDLILWACRLGNSGCAENSAQQILQLIKNPLAVGSNQDLYAIICQSLRVLNDTSSQRVIDWTTENSKSLSPNIIPCTKKREILKKYLDSKMTETNFVKFYGPFYKIMKSSEDNFYFAVDYFTSNRQALNNRFSITFSPGNVDGQIVRAFAYSIHSNARLEKFKDVLKLEAILANESIKNAELLQLATEKSREKEELVNQFRAARRQL